MHSGQSMSGQCRSGQGRSGYNNLHLAFVKGTLMCNNQSIQTDKLPFQTSNVLNLNSIDSLLKDKIKIKL